MCLHRNKDTSQHRDCALCSPNQPLLLGWGRVPGTGTHILLNHSPSASLQPGTRDPLCLGAPHHPVSARLVSFPHVCLISLLRESEMKNKRPPQSPPPVREGGALIIPGTSTRNKAPAHGHTRSPSEQGCQARDLMPGVRLLVRPQGWSTHTLSGPLPCTPTAPAGSAHSRAALRAGAGRQPGFPGSGQTASPTHGPSGRGERHRWVLGADLPWEQRETLGTPPHFLKRGSLPPHNPRLTPLFQARDAARYGASKSSKERKGVVFCIEDKARVQASPWGNVQEATPKQRRQTGRREPGPNHDRLSPPSLPAGPGLTVDGSEEGRVGCLQGSTKNALGQTRCRTAPPQTQDKSSSSHTPLARTRGPGAIEGLDGPCRLNSAELLKLPASHPGPAPSGQGPHTAATLPLRSAWPPATQTAPARSRTADLAAAETHVSGRKGGGPGGLKGGETSKGLKLRLKGRLLSWNECLCPSDSSAEALTPSMAAFEGGASREVFKVKKDHRMGP